MKIAFSCPACGKKLAVDAALAGRAGRCRGCGKRLVVPAAPAMAGGRSQAGHGGPSATVPRSAGRSPDQAADRNDLPDWQTAVASQLGTSPRPAADPRGLPRAAAASGYSLRPVTPVAVPVLARRVAPVESSSEDEEDEFVVTAPPVAQVSPDQSTIGPSPFVQAYRWLFNRLVQTTTWISETSYTVSFIIMIMAIAGGMAGWHTLAQWGTRAIVALNLVGLAGDLASLVTLSFRRSPLQGALFLVPPFTLYYLWSDWQRYRNTVDRMRIPLMTLAVVAAAYMLVPWLRGGPARDGGVTSAVERVVGELAEDFGRPQGAVDGTLRKARAWLRESLPGATPPPAGPGGGDRPASDGGR